MIKNWLVKTKQIKKKESGFISHVNYLSDQNRKSHFYSDIKILNNKAGNILKAIDDRVDYRRANGLRGGGVSNYATSFVMSLPRDIKQPNEQDWKKISIELIKDLAKVNNIDAEKMKEHCHIVLHDESKSKDKPSHIHVLVSNVIDNQVVKSISQYKTTDAVKKSFNRSVKAVLDEDNMSYKPSEKNVKNKPLWVSRAEKAFEVESVIELFRQAKKNFVFWAISIDKRLFKAAEKHSNALSANLDELEHKEPEIVSKIDSEIEKAEINNDVPEQAKVSNKRKRRRRRKQ